MGPAQRSHNMRVSVAVEVACLVKCIALHVSLHVSFVMYAQARRQLQRVHG